MAHVKKHNICTRLFSSLRISGLAGVEESHLVLGHRKSEYHSDTGKNRMVSRHSGELVRTRLLDSTA